MLYGIRSASVNKREKSEMTALFMKNIPKVGWDGIFRKFKDDKQLLTKLGIRKS